MLTTLDDGQHGEEDGVVKQLSPGEYLFPPTMGAFNLWNQQKWKAEQPGNIVVEFEGNCHLKQLSALTDQTVETLFMEFDLLDLAQGANNIMVALSRFPGQVEPYYAVVVGAFGDSKSVIRKGGEKDVRAICERSHLCSSWRFSKYWVMCKDGFVCCGIGDKVGESIIVAWKDHSPIPVEYVSFAGYREPTKIRAIKVYSSHSPMAKEIDWTVFVPKRLSVEEEEREKAKLRASRFGLCYTEPTTFGLLGDLPVKESSPTGSRHSSGSWGSRAENAGNDRANEERRKRFDRFGVTSDAAETAIEIEEHKQALASRAERFQLPSEEEHREAKAILASLSWTGTPRQQESKERQRSEAIHLYGDLKKYEKDVYRWFKEYCIEEIEWVNNFALNLVFDDKKTADRVWRGVAKRIPCCKEYHKLKALQKEGWAYVEFDRKIYLLRQATYSDHSRRRARSRTRSSSRGTRRSSRYRNYSPGSSRTKNTTSSRVRKRSPSRSRSAPRSRRPRNPRIRKPHAADLDPREQHLSRHDPRLLSSQRRIRPSLGRKQPIRTAPREVKEETSGGMAIMQALSSSR